MRYTERSGQLKDLCKNGDRDLYVNDTGVRIRFYSFQSQRPGSGAKALTVLRRSVPGVSADENIPENKRFVYPVFLPPENRSFKRAIIMLHGLNERRWDKYLSWAHELAVGTGKPVVVFPMSFHINRSAPEWLNPRDTMKKMEEKDPFYFSRNQLASFINFNLSERMILTPQRFFISGYQTVIDIVDLMHQMFRGALPGIGKGTQADLFAYSIGGMLGQVLLMSDPDKLLSDSKLFLFCAGSVFADMNGISKVIMNEQAHHRLQEYYGSEFEEEIQKNRVMGRFFNKSKAGMAFRSLLSHSRFGNLRNSALKSCAKRVFALSFKNDRVIPPEGIERTLSGANGSAGNMLEVHDYSFPYTHEIPFPINQDKYREKVDDAFDRVFGKAVLFLS